jgi:hypothetical protein
MYVIPLKRASLAGKPGVRALKMTFFFALFHFFGFFDFANH